MKEAAARIIARLAHAGQKYGNDPYITHIWRVVERVKKHEDATFGDVVLAWLHDTVEDTTLGFIDLDDLGYDTSDLRVITRHRHDTYAEYIKKIRLSPSAMMVKVADLEENLSHNPTPSHRRRYEDALEVLKAW